jgi:hypothetical protein
MAGSGEPIGVLEQREQWFDGSAGVRNQLVAANTPSTHVMPAIASPRDPVANAECLGPRRNSAIEWTVAPEMCVARNVPAQTPRRSRCNQGAGQA